MDYDEIKIIGFKTNLLIVMLMTMLGIGIVHNWYKTQPSDVRSLVNEKLEVTPGIVLKELKAVEQTLQRIEMLIIESNKNENID